MTEAWCEKYDMAVLGCAHCRGNNQTVQEQADAEVLALRAHLLATDSRWFPSQYPGRCAKCNTPFDPEALIRRGHMGIELLPDTMYVAECCARP
jgi:hypothetical protein